MDIRNIELIHYEAVEAGTETGSNGQPLAIAAQPEVFSFLITYEDDTTLTVPNDTTNRHYWEVKEWYDAQETKPFDFTFEELPEPVFAETIYPPEPEEPEVPDPYADAIVTETPAPEEPETLLPR